MWAVSKYYCFSHSAYIKYLITQMKYLNNQYVKIMAGKDFNKTAGLLRDAS